jgi:hypothetical protein
MAVFEEEQYQDGASAKRLIENLSENGVPWREQVLEVVLRTLPVAVSRQGGPILGFLDMRTWTSELR